MSGMDAFIGMLPQDRATACLTVGDSMHLDPVSVEKDLWVCWTLRELFGLPGWGAHFTFKGGTALAKAWKLIDRFSEDIDIVIDRDFLGFGGEKSPEAAPSKSQRNPCLRSLGQERCRFGRWPRSGRSGRRPCCCTRRPAVPLARHARLGWPATTTTYGA